jgi:hypothetical protein
MSQTSRFTRARQLTSTVLPGRRPDDYADQVTGRLRRIAAARSTGMLPFSGRSDGSIYFRDGKVAYAESTRTPGPAPHDQPAPDESPLNKITAILATSEPTVDAALESLPIRPGATSQARARLAQTMEDHGLQLGGVFMPVAVHLPAFAGDLAALGGAPA